MRHIVRTDEDFPRPIQTGESKQSRVYFDYAELVQWHKKQKQCLVQQNNMERDLRASIQQFNLICLHFKRRKHGVSKSARDLVKWKYEKPVLTKIIHDFKQRLQLTLFDDENREGE